MHTRGVAREELNCFRLYQQGYVQNASFGHWNHRAGWIVPGGVLLEKGYEVYGIVRRSSLEKYDRVERIAEQIKFVEGDLTDQSHRLDLDQITADELWSVRSPPQT